MAEIKAMTYNLQLGAGSDNYLKYIFDYLITYHTPHSPKNIEKAAAIVKAIDPDIAAFTESEGNSWRSNSHFYLGGASQNFRILDIQDYDSIIRDKTQLNSHVQFPAHKVEVFGGVWKNQNNSIHTKHKIIEGSYKFHEFPHSDQKRGIGEAKVNVDGLDVTVLLMHLSPQAKYRKSKYNCTGQLECVAAISESRAKDGLTIIMGDFNVKSDGELKHLKSQPHLQEVGPRLTWSSWNPNIAIDRMFVSKEFGIEAAYAPRTWPLKENEVRDGVVFTASDHLPLVARLRY